MIDFLEIQNFIEEKKLRFGIAIEKASSNLIKNAATKIITAAKNFLSTKNATFFSCLTIILLSSLALSNRDLGHDSAVYIEIAQKILAGKKYYYDFFENNFPLSFFFTIIPIYAAKFFKISPILTTQFFIYAIGATAIFFSHKIMLKNYEEKYKTQTEPIIIKLLTISFCFAFFFRAHTSNFGEIATKSSYFLALFFPYLSHYIFYQKPQATTAILAALMICLKPHYAIVFVVFEIAFLSRKTNVFLIKKCAIILAITTTYCAAIWLFTPQYFLHIQDFATIYFNKNHVNIFTILKNDIFPILALIAVFGGLIDKKSGEYRNILRPILVANIALAPIILLELIGALDQRAILLAILPSLIIAYFFTFVKKNRQKPRNSIESVLGRHFPTVIARSALARRGNPQSQYSQDFGRPQGSPLQYFSRAMRHFSIKFNKNLLFALTIFIIPQFQPQEFFEILLNLCYFWWILLFFNKKSSFFSYFLAFLSIFLIFFDKKGEFSWIFCAIITIYYLAIFKKFDKNCALNLKTLAILSLILSYFSAIFFNNFNELAKTLKSPNASNQQKIAIMQKFAPKKDENAIFIVDKIHQQYPAITYLNKQNPLSQAQNEIFFENIAIADTKNQQLFVKNAKIMEFLFTKTKKQLRDEKSMVVFIEKNNYSSNKCTIGFIEYYFLDQEFREIFTKNYEFLTEIYQVAPNKNEALKNPFAKTQNLQEILPSKEIKYGEIEVYIRKK